MSKCPMSQDGKCQSAHMGGIPCGGYLDTCDMRHAVEDAMEDEIQKLVMKTLGVRERFNRERLGMLMSDIRECNWVATGYEGKPCEHYIGGGDWGLDCKLQYWLCNGPGSDRCPLVFRKECR